VHPFAAGQASLARARRPRRTGNLRTIRASLGFFIFLAGAGCAAPDVRSLAHEADGRYGTSTFTWLVDHEPSAVVTWGVPAATVRAILPHDRVLEAPTTGICATTHRAHALLVLIAPAGARAKRDVALDCGFALDRDAGGMVVAPL
jgi:hypothetical protein